MKDRYDGQSRDRAYGGYTAGDRGKSEAVVGYLFNESEKREMDTMSEYGKRG